MPKLAALAGVTGNPDSIKSIFDTVRAARKQLFAMREVENKAAKESNDAIRADWRDKGVSIDEKGFRTESWVLYISMFIMGFVLMFARGFHAYLPNQARRVWDATDPGTIYLPEATAVIIGVGGIGGEAARHCAHFGINVIGVDARRKDTPEGVARLVRDELVVVVAAADRPHKSVGGPDHGLNARLHSRRTRNRRRGETRTPRRRRRVRNYLTRSACRRRQPQVDPGPRGRPNRRLLPRRAHRAPDAGDELQGDPVPPGDFDEKRYGFSIGGPIVQDKLFFFAAYEKAETASTFDRCAAGGRIAQYAGRIGDTIDIMISLNFDLCKTFALADLPIVQLRVSESQLGAEVISPVGKQLTRIRIQLDGFTGFIGSASSSSRACTCVNPSF